MITLLGTIALNILGVVVALAAVIYAYFKYQYQYWSKHNVPFMEPKFPFGSLNNPFGKKSKSVYETIQQIYDAAKSKGSKYIGIYSMASPTFVPVDLDIIKHVMTKDFSHFIDRGMYVNEKDDPMSAHLFALSGKKWRNLRVKLTPAFTSGKLKMMFQTLVDCGLVMEEYIENNVKSTEAVDIKEIFTRFSTDIIGSCAFGIECNTFKEPDSPFRETAKNMSVGNNRFKRLLVLLTLNNHALGRALHVRSIKKEVSDFYTKVVKDTVNHRLENNYKRKDLLQILIDMMEKREGHADGYVGDGTTLTMNEIVAQCFLFFIAGFDTSATTMTYSLFHMATHQEVQDKVRKELQEVLAKHDDQMTYDSLIELKYMKQVIDENLRLYPPVPIVNRECVEDYKLPNDDVIIEKGVKVFVPIIGLHRDKKYFPNPEKFDPDRFSEENKKKIPQYAFIPFGEGPRNCIGERFGIMQTKVGLACLLRKFKVTLSEKTKVPLKLLPRTFNPVADGGIWLHLEKL